MEPILPPITDCTDEQKLLRFLKKVDHTLPVPLSARTDLVRFGRNILKNGYVLGIEEDGELVCAALFYYHFQIDSAAYLDLMATLPTHTGRGYAKRVMDAMEQAAARDGMTEFHLHTNDTNTAALSLYGKRGYVVIAHDPKVHMRKML